MERRLAPAVGPGPTNPERVGRVVRLFNVVGPGETNPLAGQRLRRLSFDAGGIRVSRRLKEISV